MVLHTRHISSWALRPLTLRYARKLCISREKKPRAALVSPVVSNKVYIFCAHRPPLQQNCKSSSEFAEIFKRAVLYRRCYSQRVDFVFRIVQKTVFRLWIFSFFFSFFFYSIFFFFCFNEACASFANGISIRDVGLGLAWFYPFFAFMHPVYPWV